VQKYFYRQSSREWEESLAALSPINPAFARETDARRRLEKQGFVSSFINRLDSFEYREQVLRPYCFSHQGVIATKLSLANNIAVRDPTMDKRLIEFSFSLPEDQWIRNGASRFLLRRAMRGLLPDKVRLEESVSGLQSADWLQRLQKRWSEVYAEMAAIGEIAAERRYLDVARIQAELKKYAVLNEETVGNLGLRMLARSLVFSRFLRADSADTR
jgi:asparagine synthase (glutamine-hydrolysing)